MSTTASSHSSTLHKLFLPIIFLLALLLSVIQFIITAVLIHDYEDHRYPSDSTPLPLVHLLLVSTVFTDLSFCQRETYRSGVLLRRLQPRLHLRDVALLVVRGCLLDRFFGGTLHCGDLFLNNQVLDISIPYCGSLRAVQAFSWMIWLLFSAALVYISAIAIRAKSRPSGLTGPMREVPAATSAA
ncbi:hypothetical protein PCASD_07888 [Puccinia coronata f. sp. avenae]|uniref:MARVEL domain-containing protein n=1 Tax=Puccinia coronata f. sp. avenae TaxID=200324 RepID=A0A2N5UQ45_9BASI|nr:hypothetical protein PCASD_07888 [Puccinia coronata f. sp. avenae]